MCDRELTDFLLRCGVAAERLARLDVLARLYHDLREANRATNLTRITAEAEYWHLHVADSLSVGLAAADVLREPLALADVGCGAGFPLLPLAWANPALRATGIESRGKKADFVRREIESLGLANCRVAAGRARELARVPEHAARYDVVLLRAVGPAARLVGQCRLLLRNGAAARMILYETPAAVARQRGLVAREAGKFGLAVAESEAFALPGGSGTRQFVILTRPGNT